MSETIDGPRFDPVLERTFLITRLSELAGNVSLSAFEFVSNTESVQVISGIASVPSQDGELTGETVQINVLYYLNKPKHLAQTIGFPKSGASPIYDLNATQSSIEQCVAQRNALEHAQHDAIRRYYLERAVFGAEMSELTLHNMMANAYSFNVDLQYFRSAQV